MVVMSMQWSQSRPCTSMEVTPKPRERSVSCMLMTTIKRKRLMELIAWLETNCADAVVTVGDVKSQRGAYMRSGSIGRLRCGK